MIRLSKDMLRRCASMSARYILCDSRAPREEHICRLLSLMPRRHCWQLDAAPALMPREAAAPYALRCYALVAAKRMPPRLFTRDDARADAVVVADAADAVAAPRARRDTRAPKVTAPPALAQRAAPLTMPRCARCRYKRPPARRAPYAPAAAGALLLILTRAVPAATPMALMF